jgi:hypothetical protein
MAIGGWSREANDPWHRLLLMRRCKRIFRMRFPGAAVALVALCMGQNKLAVYGVRCEQV